MVLPFVSIELFNLNMNSISLRINFLWIISIVSVCANPYRITNIGSGNETLPPVESKYVISKKLKPVSNVNPDSSKTFYRVKDKKDAYHFF